MAKPFQALLDKMTPERVAKARAKAAEMLKELPMDGGVRRTCSTCGGDERALCSRCRERKG